MSLLKIENLQFAWRGQPPLLQIVDFQLDFGEKLFLHGASGSGKTSLLSLISGTQLATSGNIFLLEQNLSKLNAYKRDKYRSDHSGYIFQQFNLLAFLAVLDNVILPCNFSKIRRQKALQNYGSVQKAAEYLLESLGINASLWQRRAGELSIGQQQRVAAARALIGAPELIIADEPTSSLDFDARQAFLELLFAQCQSAKSSLLFVSHDQSLAHLFDRSVALSSINLLNS